jgi:hypothetical protein
MKKAVLLLFALIVVLSQTAGWAQESTLVEIAGHVTDQETKGPLPGVSVYVKGTGYGHGHQQRRGLSAPHPAPVPVHAGILVGGLSAAGI